MTEEHPGAERRADDAQRAALTFANAWLRRAPMRLRTSRLKRVLTQDALAKNIGMSCGYLACLEMGRHHPPLSRLRKLVKGLGVPAGERLE